MKSTCWSCLSGFVALGPSYDVILGPQLRGTPQSRVMTPSGSLKEERIPQLDSQKHPSFSQFPKIPLPNTKPCCLLSSRKYGQSGAAQKGCPLFYTLSSSSQEQLLLFASFLLHSPLPTLAAHSLIHSMISFLGFTLALMSPKWRGEGEERRDRETHSGFLRERKNLSTQQSKRLTNLKPTLIDIWEWHIVLPWSPVLHIEK